MTTSFHDPLKQEICDSPLALKDSWTMAKGNPEQLTEYFHENMVAITPSRSYRPQFNPSVKWHPIGTQ